MIGLKNGGIKLEFRKIIRILMLSNKSYDKLDIKWTER
jgi:hypothetical protein